MNKTRRHGKQMDSTWVAKKLSEFVSHDPALVHELVNSMRQGHAPHMWVYMERPNAVRSLIDWEPLNLDVVVRQFDAHMLAKK